MDYFEQYAKSLPQPLDPEEQRQLLIKYYETKDEDARTTLLEHNLRLCVMVAREACYKYNCPDLVDQTFSVCYEELANSLDKYNPYNADQAKFSYYATTNMKLVLLRTFANENQIKYHLIDTVFLKDDEEESIFQFFYDESESHIAEDSASSAFVEDITSHLNTLSSKRKQVMQMYLGIGYPCRFTQAEIAQELGVSRQNISLIVNDTLADLQKYITKNYTLSMPDLSNNSSQKSLTFANVDERDKYIFESYYGLNGKKPKNINQLSSEVHLGIPQIKKIAYGYKESLSKTEQNGAVRQRVDIDSYSQYPIEAIFNDYYGLNGSKIHESSEIKLKYGLSQNVFSNILSITKAQLISEGKYTQEQINELKQSREDRKNKLSLNKHADAYFSHYGLHGYTQKSRLQLSAEYNVALSTIDLWLRQYKQHLASLSPAEREAEIAKYSKIEPEKE